MSNLCYVSFNYFILVYELTITIDLADSSYPLKMSILSYGFSEFPNSPIKSKPIKCYVKVEVHIENYSTTVLWALDNSLSGSTCYPTLVFFHEKNHKNYPREDFRTNKFY